MSVSLKAEIGDFVGKMGTAGRSAKQFGDELGGLGKKSPKALNDVAFAAGGAGIALLGMAGYAVKTAMDFDKQMSAVSAATKASASDMGLLRAAALQAGKDTIFSATGAAQAQTELAKAGVSVRDILGGGLKGALDLAAAGTMEVGDAAEIAATAMNQFGLSGKDIPHIADLLAAGAGKAQGEVSDMGMALKQGGLVAAQFDMSIEETTGTLAAFASAGLIGSDAGTSLKTMLLQLANPSKKAAETMRELGINAYDAQGKFVGTTQLAGILKDKLSGLTQEQRNAALATIFGSDAIRAASILYKQGASGIDDWINKTNDQAYATDQAARKTDNLAGDMERLKGSFETLMISAGSGANSGLRTLVQGADAAVAAFSSLPGPVQTTITVLAGLSGAGLLGVAGLLKVKQTADDAMTALRGMGDVGPKVADGLGKVGKFAGYAGVAIGGIALAWGAAELISHLTGFDKQVTVTERDIGKMTEALKQFADTGKVTGELQKSFGKDLSGIKAQSQAIADLGKQLAAVDKMNKGLSGAILNAGGNGPQAGSQGMQATLAQYKANFDAVDKSLANLVNSGNATAAKVLLENIAKSAGMSVDDLLKKMPGYQSAASGAAAASTGLAQGFGDAEANARTLAGSLDAAFQAGQSLKQVLDQLNGANLNLAQAQLNAEEATRKLDQALKDSGGSMDITTEKGGAAQQTAINLARSYGEVLQKMQEQGAQAGELGGAYDSLRQKFIDHISTAGGTRRATEETRRAAEDLATQWFSMPKAVQTPVSAPGLSETSGRLDKVENQLNRMDGKTAHTYLVNEIAEIRRTTYITSGGPPSSYFRGNRWGGVYEPAAVGLLRDASMYSTRSPGRYMIAEPQTGGEAFIPRNGNRARSLGILSKAASWYGANITAGGTGGTYAPSFQVNVNAGMGSDGANIGAQVVAALKQYERSNGTVWRR